MGKLFARLKRLFFKLSPHLEKSLENTDNTSLTLSQEDQALFVSFCQFLWVQGEPLPLIYDIDDKVYTSQGITLLALERLEVIGLIMYEPRGFVKKGLGKHTRLFYAGKPTKIGFSNETNNQLYLGCVLLTNTGKEMTHSLSAPRNQLFYEYVIGRWFNQGLVLSSIQLKMESRKRTTKQELPGNR